MREIWKDIPGHEKHYQVSNLGNVRSLDRRVLCIRYGSNHYRFYKGKPLRPGPMRSGHLSVALGKDNSQLVHVLVMRAFVGPCPAGLEVRHLSGKPWENWLTNLAYGTRTENLNDLFYHGQRRYSGSDILQIRADVANGTPLSSLAEKYSVSKVSISNIVNRKSYRHVK